MTSTNSSRNRNDENRRGRKLIWLVSCVALVLAILALILTQCTTAPTTNASPTPCPSASVTKAVDGLNAYELWKSVGNSGTLHDFLDSLVGEQGPSGTAGANGEDGAVIYIGSNGFDGPVGATGVAGASAYQLWLDAGNTGTSQDFLDSLAGADGANGPSAYDVWQALGNTGTEQDFIDFLVGATGAQGIPGPSGSPGPSGAPGTDGGTGATGQSAYQLWLSVSPQTGTETEAQFLASLIGAPGATGEQGIPGTCTIGDTGPVGPAGADGATGATGASAYNLWVANGGTGTVIDFLASLVGPKGDTGATGPAGTNGTNGTSGMGDSGSFWDVSTQLAANANTAYPMYYNQTNVADNKGVSIVNGSGTASNITFTHPGIYNLAFSAQVVNTGGGAGQTVTIWLAKKTSPSATALDVPASATDVQTMSNSGRFVAAWNFFVPVTCTTDVTPVCDSYQIMWSTTNTSVQLLAATSGTAPGSPAIPSVILTVNQVK